MKKSGFTRVRRPLSILQRDKTEALIVKRVNKWLEKKLVYITVNVRSELVKVKLAYVRFMEQGTGP